MNVKIESSWKEILKDEFEKEYFLRLREKYLNAIKNTYVLPEPKFIFHAFNKVRFNDVKVVILGQDPYHNIENNSPLAHGLSFSVPHGVRIPPSLKNIFNELNRDLKIPIPKNGDLSKWCTQGVLLLNSILSVERGKPLSHREFGWEIFTNKVIESLSNERKGIIFMLWGNYARSKKSLINLHNHYVLEAPHPSPLARGFSGCGHFSKCNFILKQNKKEIIQWDLN